jgi:quercetin dioxygenase-like cupin family protein
MKCGLRAPILVALVVGLAACAQDRERPAMEQEAAGAEMEAAPAAGQVYPNMPAELVFENERFVAQRLSSEPGQWAGDHSHTGGQLVVVLEGGTQTYREGGEETTKTREAGDVFWVEPTEAHDHAVSGDSPFTRILVTIAETEGMSGVPQTFPNIPVEVVFENERVVAQRISSEPGQWAGEHSHTAGQLLVVLKGGTITYREGDAETPVTYAEGEVFSIEPTEAHDHAVTGDSPFVGVLITVK